MDRTRCNWIWLAAASLLVGAFGLMGCSSDTAPTAVEWDFDDGDQDAVVFGFSSGVVPAGKSAGDDSDDGIDDDPGGTSFWTAGRWIGPRGGKIRIRDKGRKRDDDGNKLREFISVDFSVPKGALDERAPIRMAVRGYYLSQLAIGFRPSGLEFNKDAKLKIHLGRDRVDVDATTIEVTHTWVEDGVTHTETMKYDVDVNGHGDAVIQIRIPGFSRYSLGD